LLYSEKYDKERKLVKTTTVTPTKVIEVLKRTAIHTLNTYGDQDPDGERILQGLSAIAQTVIHACGLDDATLDSYNAALTKATESRCPANTEYVTIAEMEEAHLLVRELFEGADFDGDDLEKITEAADYLKDFWETVNAD
jgi:hypothetical protein